jgi:tetratricopeptide (TPR) repeat protein
MVDGGGFDLVLFGYRNDVACARVLERLALLPPTPEGPAGIDRASALPQRLFASLPYSRAQQLVRELEQLGAQVALVPLSPAAVAEAEGPNRARLARWTIMLAIVLAVAVSARWLQRAPTVSQELSALSSTTAPESDRPLAVIGRRDDGVDEANDPAFAEALELNAEAVELAARGDHVAAKDRLERAWRLVPTHPTIRLNLQNALLNAALHEIEQGHPNDALDRLFEAAELGERSDVRQAIGVAHLRAGQYEEAREHLERASEERVNDAGLWLALGETYLRGSDRVRALDALQRARDAGASSPELEKLLARLGREVDAEWDFSALESAHFRVSFAEGENRAAAQLVLDGLEDARSETAARLGVFPERVIEVVLYAAQDFHAITQTPDWAGGAYDGRIKVPVRGLEEDSPALARILRHEFMHSLVGQLSGDRCPVWLSEGLAVWAEEEGDGERRAWAEEVVHGARLFPLYELEGPFTSLAPPRALVAYAQSYLVVRELIDRHGTRRLVELLQELRARSVAGAFAAVYAGELADFERSVLGSDRS